MARRTMKYLFDVMLVVFLVFMSTNGTFVEHPVDQIVVESRQTQLDCQVNPDTVSVEWYTYVTDTKGENKVYRIQDGFRNRFFLTSRSYIGQYKLFINSTQKEDTGTYFCLSDGVMSRNATLRVLPITWIPFCSQSPSTSILVGQNIQVTCASVGDLNTHLRWMRNNDVITNTFKSTNESSVILQANVELKDKSEVYICEATLEGLREPEICVLRPIQDGGRLPSSAQIIAYVIVGVLSVIVIILFVVMILVVSRRRQCRYCQEDLPEPQVVLDITSLQNGQIPPVTAISDNDSDSIGSANDLVISSPPPDVVPTVYSKGNMGQKSPTSTLKHNLDTYHEEKPEPKIKSSKLSGKLKRKAKKSGALSDTSPRETSGVDEDANNIPSSTSQTEEGPSTSSAGQIHLQDINIMNDLGAKEKETLYRKKKVSGSNGTRKQESVTNATDQLSLNIKYDEQK